MAEVVVGAEQHAHTRYRDTGRGRRLEQHVLGCPLGPPGVHPRVAPQHESVPGAAGCDEIERPCLARRATRQPAQPFDGSRAACRQHDSRERDRVGCTGRHPQEASAAS